MAINTLQALGPAEEFKGSYTLYRIMRQLELLRWLNSSGKTYGNISIGNLITQDKVLVHDSFFRLYDLPINRKTTLFHVMILNTASVAEKYPYTAPIAINSDYPNLYLAQITATNQRIAFEISADETSVLHRVLTQQSAQPSATLAQITTDAELQPIVAQVMQNLNDRLASMMIPFIQLEDAEDISLYLPCQDVTTYQSKLKWFIQHGDFSHEEKHIHHQRPDGYVARRLRDLGMTLDKGSIPGVYGISQQRNDWKEMDLVERAYFEKRILGGGLIDIDDKAHHVLVIGRDKTVDKVGFQIVLTNDEKLTLVTTSGYNVEDVNRHEEDVSDYLEELDTTLSPSELANQCENFYDGLRVLPWLSTLFEIIEQDISVTPSGVNQLLSQWMTISENQK